MRFALILPMKYVFSYSMWDALPLSPMRPAISEFLKRLMFIYRRFYFFYPHEDDHHPQWNDFCSQYKILVGLTLAEMVIPSAMDIVDIII